MTDMVERVAEAIAGEDRDDDSGDYYRRMARAAIEAMREPDEKAAEAIDRRHFPSGLPTADAWRHLIDAALSQSGEG